MYERLIASIVRCLRKVLETDSLTSDSRESLEVSIQCLESAYNIDQEDETDCFDILHLYNAVRFTPKTHEEGPTTAEMMEEAERLKNEGNDLIRAEKYREAAALYTK
ncbi:hypothetical protein QAD02_021704 [Eretmocerus hayati]|uniref:Uncharacterized protein n=1 Tax=Eretmocerus hayati TaxID=131215 RepID=A0ACC2PQY6_9HYME|nr:hypothetical protein QAD02_021704 [Eretmocerus hayati]